MSLIDLLPKDLTNEIFFYLNDKECIKCFLSLSDKIIKNYSNKENSEYLYKKKFGGTCIKENIMDDYVTIIDIYNNFTNLNQEEREKFIQTLIEQQNYIIIKSLIDNRNNNLMEDENSIRFIFENIFKNDNEEISNVFCGSEVGLMTFWTHLVKCHHIVPINPKNFKNCKPILEQLKHLPNMENMRTITYMCVTNILIFQSQKKLDITEMIVDSFSPYMRDAYNKFVEGIF
jgi:hypothetical protein